jgi:hypothetical protein
MISVSENLLIELEWFGFFFFYKIRYIPLVFALYSWVCQMLHETSYQIINIYIAYIYGQSQTSELLWHDASSAHKMHVVIANYNRYVCVCAFNYGGFWELLQYWSLWFCIH